MDIHLFASTINSLLPEPQASLLAGILFGVKTTMPDQFYQDLITTGTLHVIALSGMNVSIIIRLLFDFTGNLLGKRFGVVLTLLGIGGFIWLVGPSPTIIRASIMGSLTVVAMLLGRRNVPLLALLVSAATMVLVNSSLLKNISFQLSFLATLGIILFAGQKINRTIGHPSGVLKSEDKDTDLYKSPKQMNEVSSRYGYLSSLIKNDLRVTLSAQVFTVPVIFYHFHRVSLISPVANVATGWLVPPIMYGGFLMVLCSLLFRPLGHIVALVVWVPLTIFIWVVELMAGIPGASVTF